MDNQLQQDMHSTPINNEFIPPSSDMMNQPHMMNQPMMNQPQMMNQPPMMNQQPMMQGAWNPSTTPMQPPMMPSQMMGQQYDNQPQYEQQNPSPNQDYKEFENYEDYDQPTGFKRILYELKLPFIVFVVILLCFNKVVSRQLITFLPSFGDQYFMCNKKGFVLLALLASIIVYIIVKYTYV